MVWADEGVVVRERASRALSMPVALRAGALLSEGAASSSCERSRGRAGTADFLTAVLVFLGAARAFFSSAARRASFSAFLARVVRRLASASSLQWGLVGEGMGGVNGLFSS